MIAVSLDCISFLMTGFLLNALCERRELDYKSSCVLILLAFIVMSLLGAIPYVYLDPVQSPTLNDRVTNSLFEVGSALTTNGISMGVMSLSLPTFYKFVLMVAMIIGKVEILIVLVTIYLGKPIIGGAVKAAASWLRGFVKGIIIG
ncbi:TPA: hypothetical protein HA344_02630 [Candidatus Bathyarchaeota archaeon]|nr:hypothetical protein [Candidatus Bathyarchaeota archaeon]